MASIVVLSISIVLQFAAAVLALYLIRTTGVVRAWLLLAMAVLVMAIRRFFLLVSLLTGSMGTPPNLVSESLGLVISALMLAGIACFYPVFRQFRESTEELHSSQRRLSTLLSNMPGMAYRCENDPAWTMDFVSDGCYALLGYRPEDLVHNRLVSYEEVIHPDHRRLVHQQVASALERREPFRMVYRIHTAAGDEKWVWEQGIGVRDGAGNIEAIEGFITDITERRQAEEVLQQARHELEQRVEARTAELAQANDQLVREIGERRQAVQALRESELRFRNLVETTSDWIWEMDQSGRYTYASPRVADLLGYPSEEILGKTPWDLMSVRESDRVRPVLEQAFGEHEPFARIEYISRHRDGRRIVVESSGVPFFDADSSFRGYRGVDRDITKPKENEAKLQEAMARLEQSNRDLQQFAYSASHDLQEPLRMMSSYLRALDSTAGEKLDESGRTFVALSLDSARRMQQLIGDLLAFARVGSRRTAFEAVNTASLVDRVVADLGGMLQANAAEVAQEGLPCVNGDATLLGQLFQNLISNAIKFHDARPPRVHVSARRENGHWLFAIRDNGIGIPPASLERVFVIFERLHTEEEYPGTGIGLAICKRVVEHHGGRIWAESTPGEGTTFYFTLPSKDGHDENGNGGSAHGDPPR